MTNSGLIPGGLVLQRRAEVVYVRQIVAVPGADQPGGANDCTQYDLVKDRRASAGLPWTLKSLMTIWDIQRVDAVARPGFDRLLRDTCYILVKWGRFLCCSMPRELAR